MTHSSPKTQNEPDPEAILQALGVAATETTRIHGGRDALLWRVQSGERTCALRVLRPEQKERVRQEARVMRLAAENGISVPTIYAESVWEDRPVQLMSWCAGKPLGVFLQQKPASLVRLGRQFGQVQAQIHAVALPETWRDQADSWGYWGKRETLELRALWDSLPAEKVALLHLDYHPLNVMTDGSALTGVLDWANVGLGDPRADLARTVSILRLSPLSPDVPAWVERYGRRLLEVCWRQGYRRRAGKWPENMAPFYLWAGAAIMEDIPSLKNTDRMTAWCTFWAKRAAG